MFFNSKRGFTLIELMVVISIMGLLSSVIMSAVNSARTKADNTQRNQIAEEYRKAIMLAYDANGGYPYPAVLSTYYCLGDYSFFGLGNYNTLDVCGNTSTGSYANDEDVSLETAVVQFLPSLPVMKVTSWASGSFNYTYKGPLYACTSQVNGKCTVASLRWRLQGAGLTCIKGATNATAGNSTLCTLSLQ